MRAAAFLVSVILVLIKSSSCARERDFVTATCHMEPNRKSNNLEYTVTGTVTLSQRTTGGPTKIKMNLKGVAPYRVLGFHVHKYGDVISNGCQSCGGHYSPFDMKHAGPRDETRHAGDIGNVMSNRNGQIKTEFFDYLVSLIGPSNSVIGRSLVLHARRDDLGTGQGAAEEESLRTGNAGARLACCSVVIGPPA